MTDPDSQRRILRITGPETRDFLQGLVTNDVKRLDQGAVYAALLTPQGKMLTDFFLVPDGDAVLMDLPASEADTILKRLSMYKLRAKVDIEPTDLHVMRGTGPAPEGALADPRHPDLGWRLYGATSGDDGTDWNAVHVATLTPRWGIELGPESYPLEMGFERLHGVDFRKGCYVGQEVTARMKHKTELRKGLARVTLQGTAAPGDEITTDGKPVGTLGTIAGDTALAYLRFDRAEGVMQAGQATLSRA